MNEQFSIKDKVAIISGACGVLGGSVAKSFLLAGAKVVAIGTNQEKLDARLMEFSAFGKNLMGCIGDVLNIHSMEDIAQAVIEKWGRIDILLNVAGGNMPGATLTPDQSFFDMKIEDWDKVTNLNMNGTVYPCYVFGKYMAEQRKGSIINISSMAAYQAITRVPGYSAAKTAVNNFTQWLAMEMAQRFGDGLRVNAIAPGFFIGNQNRGVLLHPDGSYTERSEKIISKTPMKRFGNLDELNGAIQFLCSDASSFITGVVLAVDGGFNAFSGV